TARGDNLTLKEAWKDPAVASVISKWVKLRTEASEALNAARARYYQTPEGLKELNQDLELAEAEASRTSDALEAVDTGTAAQKDPEVVAYRKRKEAEVNKMRWTINGRAQIALDRAKREGNVQEYQRITRLRD